MVYDIHAKTGEWKYSCIYNNGAVNVNWVLNYTEQFIRQTDRWYNQPYNNDTYSYFSCYQSKAMMELPATWSACLLFFDFDNCSIINEVERVLNMDLLQL